MDVAEADGEDKINNTGLLSENGNDPKEKDFDILQIKKKPIEENDSAVTGHQSPHLSSNIINNSSALLPTSSFHLVNCRPSTPSTSLPESVLSMYNSMAGIFYHGYCQSRNLPLKNKLSLESPVVSHHFPSSVLAAASFLKMCYPNKREEEPHEIEDVHECRWTRCVKKFDNLDKLVSHVNDQHVRTEQFSGEFRCEWDGCQRLGKGFNARYKMLVHIRTHTNEKPHKCPLCGKCFSRLENLKIHNRSHTGEKPYVCPIDGCHKAYSNSSDRFKHVRTHQEEKPYICKAPGCSKRYTDPSSLRKHVRTHGHYFPNKDLVTNGKIKPSVQESLCYHSRTFALPASYLIPSPQSESLTSVQNNYLPLSGLFTDPFLSSGILNPPGMIQDSKSKVLDSGLGLVDPKNEFDVESAVIDRENYQDSPLDLTVCTPQTKNNDCPVLCPASTESAVPT